MKAKLILNNKEYEVEVSEEQIKEIKKPKYKRWRAEEGEKYYFLSDLGEILSANDCRDKSDNFLYNTDNYFKTEEGAEFRRQQLLYLQQYKDYLGYDLVTKKDYLGYDLVTKDDWENIGRLKFRALYNYETKEIEIYWYCEQKFQGTIYSKSKEKIENFIDLIGEDNFKKYILEVEE